MFELFIALFGGAFYVGKYLTEAVKLKAYEERQLARTITLESIKARYMASYEMEQWARYFISSGGHYDDICNWFAEDFQYVLGKDWKEKLHIPKKFLPISCIYGKQSYPWSMPSAHVMWAYHLLLAKKVRLTTALLVLDIPLAESMRRIHPSSLLSVSKDDS